MEKYLEYDTRWFEIFCDQELFDGGYLTMEEVEELLNIKFKRSRDPLFDLNNRPRLILLFEWLKKLRYEDCLCWFQEFSSEEDIVKKFPILDKLRETIAYERKLARKEPMGVSIVNKKCIKCDHDKMTFLEIQNRRADEEQTIFYQCAKCRQRI